jgi:hypothetical protein
VQSDAVVMAGDVVRVIDVALAFVLVAESLVLAKMRLARHAPWPAVLAPTSMALLGVSVLFTEVGRLDHIVTWRLPVNTLGITLALCAVHALLRSGDGVARGSGGSTGVRSGS